MERLTGKILSQSVTVRALLSVTYEGLEIAGSYDALCLQVLMLQVPKLLVKLKSPDQIQLPKVSVYYSYINSK